MSETKTTKTTKTSSVKTPKLKTEKKIKVEVSLEASIFSQKGISVGNISLPGKVFGVKWNADLVHEVVTSMMSNARAGTAHTKDRSEVSGGGRKPWKQKGTGRARHGSTRSPIWSGGGTTFGPRKEKDYTKKINKKMRVKALFTVLSNKYTKGDILFIDSLNLDNIKTKDAQKVLENFSKIDNFSKINSKKKTGSLFVLSESNVNIEKSFANLPGATIIKIGDLNPVLSMKFRNLVFINPESIISFLESKLK